MYARTIFSSASRIIVITLALQSGISLAQDRASSESQVSVILEAAADANLAVKVNTVAALRANSDVVRGMALRLADQYSRERRKLKEIALNHGLTIRDELNADRAYRLLVLQRYTGNEFDREYLTFQVMHDRRSARLLGDLANATDDIVVRDFAASRSAMLQAAIGPEQALADTR